jgi:phenylalanyl-tRNA synthetase beta chain
MANHGRYDMLCFEGIAQALAIFQGKQKIPQYKLSKPAKLETLTIKPDVAL